MSLAKALRIGLEAHQTGDFLKSERVYRAILRAEPRQQEALNHLGLLAFQFGKADVAADLISEACHSDPGYATAFHNVGGVLMHLRDLAFAETVYRGVLELQDSFYDALVNLTVLINQQGRHEEAVKIANRALKSMPEFDGSHQEELEDYLATAPSPEATTRAMAVLSRASLKPSVLHNLGQPLAILGGTANAQRIDRQWASLNPRDPRPTHYLEALNQSDVPQRASRDFMRLIFDRFSSSFDRMLTRLNYYIPELLRDELVAERRDRGPCEEILDAGCGTGWRGPLFPWARRLGGGELTPRMLDKARERNSYDELLEGDLVEHLRSDPDRSEVISAAEVLQYFGELDRPLSAVACGPRPVGCLLFVVEKTVPGEAPAGHRLELHGRYSHTAPHLRQLPKQQGLSMEQCRQVFLRTEGGEDLQGGLVAARRPGRSRTLWDQKA